LRQVTDASAQLPTVLAYLGPAGDHNDAPLAAVPTLAHALAARVGRDTEVFGRPFRPVELPSHEHLDDARELLEQYAGAVGRQLALRHPLLLVNGRCAASLATLPPVVQQVTGCVVVWFDAHADLNIPASSPTDYLGGMALSGPLGWWDTGFGAGLTPDRLALVGTRQVDPAERRAITDSGIRMLLPAQATPAAVVDVIAGRPVVVHLDCDVFEPGLFETDYRETGGLFLPQFAALTEAIAGGAGEVVGVEIAEWQGPGSAGAGELLDALTPLLR
jgi:arginase/N-omega-hydroxy-L-arginine amidinohydrolase